MKVINWWLFHLRELLINSSGSLPGDHYLFSLFPLNEGFTKLPVIIRIQNMFLYTVQQKFPAYINIFWYTKQQMFLMSRICWCKLRAAQYSADNLLTNTGKVFTFRSVNYSTAGCRNKTMSNISKTVVFDEKSQVEISRLK